MEKTLVNLYVPHMGQKYDVYIPVFLSVKEVISLIIKSVENLVDEKFYASGEERLCYVEKNILLDNNRLIQDYGIKNGDKLILI